MNSFKYGVEVEYLILDAETYKPLWFEELNFKKLYSIIEDISLDGIPSMEGIDPEDAHDKILPYVIEGYHLKNEDNIAHDMAPKGVEIRTPVCHSISELMTCLRTLHERLESKMFQNGYRLSAISHHPVAKKFQGPRCNRRHDFWKWALEAMLTYGPDINISFPENISEKLFSNMDDFEEKINYYGPALTALSLSSPFYDLGLKKDYYQQTIKSNRTFRRSTIAPMIEWHKEEDGRVEFKFFEMSNNFNDYHAFTLMCLGLSLCDDLKSRASNQEYLNIENYLVDKIKCNSVVKRYYDDLNTESQKWYQYTDKDNKIYYENKINGKTVWKLPKNGIIINKV